MKSKIIYLTKLAFITLILGGIITSCVDYDLNQPKYLPQKISTWDLLKKMQQIVNPAQENKYQHNNSMLGDCYGRYMSITKSAWIENFSNFNAKNDWIDSPYTDVLTQFYPNWLQLKEITKGKGLEYQWAQILRVAAMHRLTDMYGPIPYSQMGLNEINAPYDSQEQVYKQMLEDLDTAITELTNYVEEAPGDLYFAEGDIVYDGDPEKWIRFANSLKLRLAMRIVYADETLAKTKAEEAVNHSIGVMKVKSDNAFIKYEPNPIYIMWDPYGDSRACADIVCYMNGYNDPRREKYFQKTTQKKVSEYHGLRTGINLGLYSTAEVLTYSAPNFKREDPLMWMNAAEVAFLKAEAALRGWNMGGFAKDFYNEGIKLSFDQYGLGNSADSYLADGSSIPAAYRDELQSSLTASSPSSMTIKWIETNDFEIGLERIMIQKWIAMWPLGQEAWSEHRRTGYPRFFKVLENRSSEASLSTELASRIPFSPAEQVRNKDSYDAAVQLLGGPDKYGTKLWWDKKTNKPKAN